MKQKKYLRFERQIYKSIACYFLINSSFLISLVFAEDYKFQIRSENFKEVFFKGDTNYQDYDSYNNQLELFFGMDKYNSLNSLEKKKFLDLALPFSSRDIRELYDDKLEQMSAKENYHLDVFFNDKL
tara:strand:+ start:93 stop:473 length:381 start_codon:yes stop_codon:yes gene_type:complete